MNWFVVLDVEGEPFGNPTRAAWQAVQEALRLNRDVAQTWAEGRARGWVLRVIVLAGDVSDVVSDTCVHNAFIADAGPCPSCARGSA